MNTNKLTALLKVAEGNPHTEILFSISLPSHILAKYQNLRNSLLSSTDFSLHKFDTTFSPRIPKNLSSGYSKLANLCLLSLQHILDKTFSILESCGKSGHSLSDPPKIGSNDQVKDLTQFTYGIEDFESKVVANLDMIKETFNAFHSNLKVLDEEVRNSHVALRREESVEQVYIENSKVVRENEGLRDEIKKIRDEWGKELEAAREQWSAGMDKMQATYERNIKELTDSHEHQLTMLRKINKEKLQVAKENEAKLIEKLKNITSDQSDVLNKLNDKILFLSSKNNDDANFVEKVLNRLDEIFEKFDLVNREYSFGSLKEKVLSKLEDLEAVLQQNRGAIVKGTKFDTQVKVKTLKEKLVANNVVLKEFEEARVKLLQHFSDSPRGSAPALTTRY